MDLFRKLETEIGQFSQSGGVYLIGNLNSRTGKKQDFILNESFIFYIDDNSLEPDTPIRRRSAVIISNKFGDCLLDLCKAVNIRIVNGRLFDNTDKMTCCTPNGESVVDYVVTSQENFKSISYMQVHDFNEFSNPPR